MVRNQDITNSNRDFAYYRLITTQAPVGTTAIKIEFIVEANGNQSLDLDDVSLTSLEQIKQTSLFLPCRYLQGFLLHR